MAEIKPVDVSSIKAAWEIFKTETNILNRESAGREFELSNTFYCAFMAGIVAISTVAANGGSIRGATERLAAECRKKIEESGE